MAMTAPRPKTIPAQLMPMGLELKLPRVDHRCVYEPGFGTFNSVRFCRILACKPLQPPASIKPRTGISNAPAQIRKNCKTSLKIADRRPPRATYAATVSEETKMLRLRSQPSTTFMTTAIAYMLMPLMSTVMNANEMDEIA